VVQRLFICLGDNGSMLLALVKRLVLLLPAST